MSQPEPKIEMQRVYLKGASLELPGAPKSFLAAGNLDVHTHLDVHVSSTALEAGVYDVVVRATLTITRASSESDDRKTVIAVVEGEQGGVFSLQNVPEADLNGILSIACPQALYPYLRVNIADLMTRATLPPFHLPDVNFSALFQQATDPASSVGKMTAH